MGIFQQYALTWFDIQLEFEFIKKKMDCTYINFALTVYYQEKIDA